MEKVKQSNVIEIGKRRGRADIYRVYQNFVKMQSDNTRSKYERVIPEFFKMVYSKNVWEITADDLESTEIIDVQDKYFLELKQQGFKNSTLINYVSIVRSFLSELERHQVFMEEDFHDYQRLKEVVLNTKKYKNDKQGRKTMGTKEFDMFSEWLVNEREWSGRYENLGYKYRLALEFMHTTAVRINATFKNIKWSDIKYEADNFGNNAWVVYALDKGGKINKKPISEKFYELIKGTFYNEESKVDDLIFGELSKRSFQNLCTEWSKVSGIHITAHSIKNGAGTKLWQLTKDPMKVKDFLDHESLETTLAYIRTENNFYESGSFILSNDISVDLLDEVEYTDIVNIIKDNQDLAYQVISKLKEKGKLD